jgi:hypothetical protein
MCNVKFLIAGKRLSAASGQKLSVFVQEFFHKHVSNLNLRAHVEFERLVGAPSLMARVKAGVGFFHRRNPICQHLHLPAFRVHFRWLTVFVFI